MEKTQGGLEECTLTVDIAPSIPVKDDLDGHDYRGASAGDRLRPSQEPFNFCWAGGTYSVDAYELPSVEHTKVCSAHVGSETFVCQRDRKERLYSHSGMA